VSAVLLPDGSAALNYLFFAVVLMPLVAMATRLAVGSRRAVSS
jgi:hypothetical protein